MKALLIACALTLALAAPVFGQTIVAETAAPVGQPAPAAIVDNSYQLGAGDTVRVTVFGETDLTGDYVVATNGSIAFPLVGEVPVAGLTPQQVSEAIAARLREGYVREPRVASAVTSYRPFYILGEVENPGTYPYAAQLDVLSAVAVAGGFTYRANRGRVYIRRLGEQREQAFSLRDRVTVRPGDTVRIGERFF